MGRRSRALAAAVAAGLSGAAWAEVPAEIGPDSWQGAGALLAGVERVVPLTSRRGEVEVGGEAAESRLRLSLVVVDLGPLVGLGPRQALHLAAFQEVEGAGVVWALVPIAEVVSFAGAARLQPGIFEIDADALAGPDRPGCEIDRAVFRIDARTLIERAERAQGLVPGRGVRLRAPVEIVRRSVRCRSP